MFKTICKMRFGRIQKSGDTLICVFNSQRLRELFGNVTWEHTHFADISMLQSDMQAAFDGRYRDLMTAPFKAMVSSVPSVDYRH